MLINIVAVGNVFDSSIKKADCIVTRNKKDFKTSTIAVLTAAEFFKQIDTNMR